VADPRDDRHRVADHRPHHPLVVEGPEVLQGAAAAGQDDHRRSVVDPAIRPAALVVAGQPGERRHDRLGRPVALHPAGGDQDPGKRPAPLQDPADIVKDRAGEAGDDADGGGTCRQRALPADVEEPLRGEAGLRLLEAEGEVAEARRLHAAT